MRAWSSTLNHWLVIHKAIAELFMKRESKWKSPFQLFSIRGQLPVDTHDGRGFTPQHSWLELSKTSHWEESSGADRFTFVWPWSVSTAALSAGLMVSASFPSDKSGGECVMAPLCFVPVPWKLQCHRTRSSKPREISGSCYPCLTSQQGVPVPAGVQGFTLLK